MEESEPEKGKRQDPKLVKEILALVVAKIVVELIVRMVFGQRN